MNRFVPFLLLATSNAFAGAAEENAPQILFGPGSHSCGEYLELIDSDESAAVLFNVYAHGFFTGAQFLKLLINSPTDEYENVGENELVYSGRKLTDLPVLETAEAETQLWAGLCQEYPDLSFAEVVSQYYFAAPEIDVDIEVSDPE